MPWSRTQTEFEMEDEDVFQPSESFATVSDPRNGQPGAVIPAKFGGPCQSWTTPSCGPDVASRGPI
jgi:hypothetical protein